MPSNFTENYQLNQWSKGDQVRMEDFNADNAKTDAAIKAEADARAAGDAALQAALNAKADSSAVTALTARVAQAEADNLYVRLLDVTLAQNATQIDLDVSQIPLAQFQKLELHFMGRSSEQIILGVIVNEIRGVYTYIGPSGSSSTKQRSLVSATISDLPSGVHPTLYNMGGIIAGKSIYACRLTWIADEQVSCYQSAGALSPTYLTWENIHTITVLSCNGSGNEPGQPFLSGARVILTGMKI